MLLIISSLHYLLISFYNSLSYILINYFSQVKDFTNFILDNICNSKEFFFY